MNLLKFGNGNQKLSKGIITFSIPAGHSCPFAKNCRSCCIRNPRKRHDIGDKRKYIIKDGPETIFRCFTAIDEVLRPSVRKQRWHNFNLLKECKSVNEMVNLIVSSLPPSQFNLPVRIHIAGDFFNQMYFDAWLTVAKLFPERVFYGYTKSLLFLIKRIDSIPANLKLTASVGGTHDHLIEQYNLRSATVVESLEQAESLGLEVDHDDSHAYGNGGSFALLVHGQQPAGSKMAKVWHKLIKKGMGGYGKQKVTRNNGRVVAAYFA